MLVLRVMSVVLILCWQATSDECQYPCIKQNGCLCNHTLMHQGDDGQNYGTCVSCDIGWTGYDCGSNVSPCVNGGTLQPDGGCVCGYSWTGAHCGSQQCVNSVGGSGPDSVVPVNYQDNQCDKCLPGYHGFACEMCTQDNQCDEPGDLCYTDLNYHVGKLKFFDCEVTDPLWVLLLSDGRPGVTARAKMQCDDYLYNCYISIWRMEADAAWLDPFMYCGLTDCILKETQGETNTSTTPMPQFATPVRYTFEALMLFSLILLQVVSVLPISSSRRSLLFAIVGVSICALLAGQIAFSSVYAHDEVQVHVINETMASYQCKHTNCTCAPDPPNGTYTPFCFGSTVGKYYVPKLTGTAALTCNTATGVCGFSQEQLGGASIGLQCTASECSNQTAPMPEFAVEDESSTIETALIAAGGVVALIAASFVASKVCGQLLQKEFHKSYDSVESQRGSLPPQSPLNQDDAPSYHSPFLKVRHPRTVSYNSAEKVTPPTESLHVQVQGLHYYVKGRETAVLNDASFDFQSGEMVAIIGPSGAGKTTLLDILARREKQGDTRGTITVNGTPITDGNASEYRRMIGFVAQEDILVPTLTVRETIYFAAKLKLPSAFPNALIESIVDTTVEVLHLQRCASTLVGGQNRRGISGGEKRRVSIATELVANPRILFLDEPTSGLDSVSAVEVMKAIVDLTRRPPQNNYASFFDFQPAVVFSIHQPSAEICDMFDRILLVSRGFVLFSGKATEAVSEVRGFVREAVDEDSMGQRRERSAAEELLRLQHVCSDDEFKVWATSAISNRNHMRELHVKLGDCVMARTAASLKYYPRTWDQISVLSRRSWASLLGAHYLLNSHAASTAFLSVALSLLYNQEGLTLAGTEDKAGMMTFLLLVIAFSSLSSLDLFISEKKLFCAERENGYYTTGAYFIVKVLFDFVPLRIVPTLLLSSTIYYPMGLRIDGSGHYLWFLFITTMFSMFVTGICFCVAIVTPSFGTAALVSALIILWHTVFGGLMLQSATIPKYLSYFKYLSPFYYGYESLMVNELEGQQCVFNPSNSEGSYTGFAVPIACQQFLFNLGLDPRHFNFDVGMLCAWTFGNLALGLIILTLVRVKH